MRSKVDISKKKYATKMLNTASSFKKYSKLALEQENEFIKNKTQNKEDGALSLFYSVKFTLENIGQVIDAKMGNLKDRHKGWSTSHTYRNNRLIISFL